jgi:hypothetical protein
MRVEDNTTLNRIESRSPAEISLLLQFVKTDLLFILNDQVGDGPHHIILRVVFALLIQLRDLLLLANSLEKSLLYYLRPLLLFQVTQSIGVVRSDLVEQCVQVLKILLLLGTNVRQQQINRVRIV